PSSFALDQAAVAEGLAPDQMVRLGGLTVSANAMYCFLLARYGIKGIFDFAHPWRPIFFAGTLFVGLFGGYRSTLILMLATFGILFCVEKLWRTGVLLIVLLAAVLSGSGLLLFANKLPLSVQRTVSFLPMRV